MFNSLFLYNLFFEFVYLCLNVYDCIVLCFIDCGCVWLVFIVLDFVWLCPIVWFYDLVFFPFFVCDCFLWFMMVCYSAECAWYCRIIFIVCYCVLLFVIALDSLRLCVIVCESVLLCVILCDFMLKCVIVCDRVWLCVFVWVFVIVCDYFHFFSEFLEINVFDYEECEWFCEFSANIVFLFFLCDCKKLCVISSYFVLFFDTFFDCSLYFLMVLYCLWLCEVVYVCMDLEV